MRCIRLPLWLPSYLPIPTIPIYLPNVLVLVICTIIYSVVILPTYRLNINLICIYSAEQIVHSTL